MQSIIFFHFIILKYFFLNYVITMIKFVKYVIVSSYVVMKMFILLMREFAV